MIAEKERKEKHIFSTRSYKPYHLDSKAKINDRRRLCHLFIILTIQSALSCALSLIGWQLLIIEVGF